MVSQSKNFGDIDPPPSMKFVGVIVGVIAAVLITLLITRPAAITTSFTPLSGLMTLKAMAAEAVPYEVAIATPNPIFIEFYADWCTTCQSVLPSAYEAIWPQPGITASICAIRSAV